MIHYSYAEASVHSFIACACVSLFDAYNEWLTLNRRRRRNAALADQPVKGVRADDQLGDIVMDQLGIQSEAEDDVAFALCQEQSDDEISADFKVRPAFDCLFCAKDARALLTSA